MRKRLSDWFASLKGTIDYELSHLNIAVAGDVAFDHHLAKVHGVNQSGKVIDMWFRETFGYRKRDGAAVLVHKSGAREQLDQLSTSGHHHAAPASAASPTRSSATVAAL